MNLNRIQTIAETQMEATAGRPVAYPASPYAQSGTQAPESELAYSARIASDSLQMLEKCVAELAGRLQPVLTQEVATPPQPSADKAQRSVTSPIGQALLSHAAQTENVTYAVRNLLNRLVL